MNDRIRKFYNNLAINYDQMTSFEKRFPSEIDKFRKLVNKFSIKSAVDAGAGTGFHSLLLVESGVKVTAVDISNKMLIQLKNNAAKRNLSIKTVNSDFLTFNLKHSSNDALICLGNSLVHLSSKTNLERAIKNFTNVLKPGGVLILQFLNYDKILKRKERIHSIKKYNEFLYIRYYEFQKKEIIFNILKINTLNLKYKLQSISILPILKNDIKKILIKSGLQKIRFYNDLDFNPFSKSVSNDVVVIAFKPKA